MPSCVSSTVTAFAAVISSQRFSADASPRVQRVQHERRQREVVDPVDLPRDVDLVLVVTVDLHEHLDAERVRAAP